VLTPAVPKPRIAFAAFAYWRRSEPAPGGSPAKFLSLSRTFTHIFKIINPLIAAERAL